jgi:hypothetical protein
MLSEIETEYNTFVSVVYPNKSILQKIYEYLFSCCIEDLEPL